jgi:hypothetical protein
VQERWERHLVRKKGTEVTVLLVEAAQNREDEGFVRDLLINIAESISKGLKLGAVVVNAHVLPMDVQFVDRPPDARFSASIAAAACAILSVAAPLARPNP